MRGLTLHRADDGTVGYVERLLERSDLPTADVRSNPGQFYVARHGAL